jgi:hypothetical protein
MKTVKATCYTQLTSRGHELRRIKDDSFVRIAETCEVVASDEAAERDGGVGAFEADVPESINQWGER